ncbi:ATP synthase subunit G atp20 [Lithohypha guttulata]|uniref:ATP synthase subunit G atp20 n=1 Tax=Lithohypha guttulata TaxID=1690604 RepID=A0AAN7TA27_9EURO|nr:ATP synthase subunit G atp20 [Lithohypha guttulata]KAK5090206.1 ATP synthase subunit G atp20 [Lithohypha guttulata]KAK5097598.1 ATP synthase subunit G atp20 [Lithohypha guttulata]
MSSSRALIRHSRNLLRRPQFRQASTAEKASEAASSAKDSAQASVSKASEGLTRVQSSAGSSISNAASSASAALNRIGGRTGRAIKFVESLIPPTIHYTRVGLELARLMVQHQKMTPPSISTFQSFFQPVTNVLRNPRSITSAIPEGSGQQMLHQARNTNSTHLTDYAIILAQVLGFFTVGEMIGRFKLVGYHGEASHEH